MQENTAKTATEWVFVANSIAQLPDAQSHVMRCMVLAEMAAQDVHDWITVSNTWAQNFNNTEMAQQCIAKAETLAEDSGDSEDWERIADLWLEKGNHQKAIGIYREWVPLGSWHTLDELKRLHGNSSDGTMPTDWLEPGMTERASYDSVVEAKEYIENNPKEAIRRLLTAESFAESTADWVRIAKIWKDDFQDSDSAIECMERAERAVDYVISDWLRISRTWNNDFQDTDNASRCAEEAESGADRTDEWIRIAKFWKANLQDSDNAIRCMEEAGKYADGDYDISEIDETYRTHFPDLDDTIRVAAILRIVAQNEGGQDITDLGVLTESPVSHCGTWDENCASERRKGSCAEYYRFTLDQAAYVTFDLISEVDTYLYLARGYHYVGEDRDEALDENDDRPDDDAEGLSATDSRIRHQLPAGTYTIEATTFSEGEVGTFTLNITIG